MPKIDFFTDEEYAALGFRSGIEIHQQLDTKQKLFCRCPVGLTDREPDMQILRHMRPTLSELGEYDGTALMEFRTRKQVIYQLFSNRTCTYEMDDTPPFPINREAVDIAIEIALLLNCRIVDEIHVTRKQYLDGSIPTGFQRTAVVGVEGWVPYKDRRIRITMVTLEEDACREVSDIGHTITFKTDRLSTPLVEVITYPDMRSPNEVAEVNRLLGDVMRATGKVRRGIGTVRQDVNVSIDGGTRVEIKGVPKIGYHKALTHFEAKRQKVLLELREESERRGLSKESFEPRRLDVTEILRGTACIPIRAALDNGGVALTVLLPGCAGLFAREIQPGRTFADEVAGRIRVVACIDTMPNLLHSDDTGPACLSGREWSTMRKELGSGGNDLIALVFGEALDARTAAEEVENRMMEALGGVPNETRQALPGGLTDFERILPGPNRMYPDTDTPPTAIERAHVEKIEAALPERPWERQQRYISLGLAADSAVRLSRSELGIVFDRLIDDAGATPREVAHILVNVKGHLGKAIASADGFQLDGLWKEALHLVTQGTVSREALPDLFKLAAANRATSLAGLASDNHHSCINKEEVEAACDAVMKAETICPKLGYESVLRFVMGRIIAKIGRRYPGRELAELVRGRLNAEGFREDE